MTAHPNPPTAYIHLGTSHHHGPEMHQHPWSPGDDHSHGSSLGAPAVEAEGNPPYGELVVEDAKSFGHQEVPKKGKKGKKGK